jgi:replication factor C subunit 1
MYAISGLLKEDCNSFINNSNYTICKVPNKNTKLLIGSKCNDGRPINESWKYKQAILNGNEIISIDNNNLNNSINNVTNYNINNHNIIKEKELLVNKYSPKVLNDIIGHKEQISILSNWLESWESGSIPENNRGVIIIGPPGIGKTTSVHLLANKFGYRINEYNASDTRSVSSLRGMIQLGIKRLVKEIIVMDEVDGISERGGVGELANMIKKTNVPFICICNEKSPKLKPLINVCLEVKFNRPMKSTIATALFKISQKEKIQISKTDLEVLCEQNGNDIRSILNALEIYCEDDIEIGTDIVSNGLKDANLRLDAFSATQKLMSAAGKTVKLDEAANLVFVDYSMIPMMVSECYVASSKGSLEDVVRASEFVGFADIIDKRIHRQQNWTLLPHYVQSIVSVSRSVSGPAPFQIFPQWLGKHSKRLKHRRWIDEIAQRMRIGSSINLRIDYMNPLQNILLNKLTSAKPDYKGLIQVMDNLRLTRDDLMDAFADVSLWPEGSQEKVEIPTKVKTAFTREYNKIKGKNGGDGITKKKTKEVKKVPASLDNSEESDEELDEDLEEDEVVEEDIDLYDLE